MFRAHSVTKAHTEKREGTHKEATVTGSGEQRVQVLLEVKKDKLEYAQTGQDTQKVIKQEPRTETRRLVHFIGCLQ